MSMLITFLAPAFIVLMLSLPLFSVARGITTGRKARRNIIVNLCAFFGLCALCVLLPVGDLIAYAADPATAEAINAGVSTGSGLGFIGAALVTGLSSLGAGIAVASAAPAAIGATSEDPKAFGKALIFVVLGEGIALYGILVSILIINKL